MSAFGMALRAEWTKFRTVPGWVAGVLAAAGLIVVLGLAPGDHGSCGTRGPGSGCTMPVGPGGQGVTDSFTFVHRPLAGDGSITVRVTALTGQVFSPDPDRPRPGVVPWAKAGLIVKAGTGQGTSYAAVMVTGGHGVRMQYDYTHDIAGSPGAVAAATPRWLRLTRTGESVTGAESADGSRWTTIGTARLSGLSATVEAGLFTTSPDYSEEAHDRLYSGSQVGPSQATGTFDHLAVRGGGDVQGGGDLRGGGDVRGGGAGPDWRSERIGALEGGPVDGPPVPDTERDGDRFRVTGSGDIAPALPNGVSSLTRTLAGTFAGLIAVLVVAAMFITAEYRHGLIRATFTASPGRIRVLAAKTVVVGATTFVTGLVAAAGAVGFGQRALRANGIFIQPAAAATELRMVVGTAALLALAAVFALGLGTLLRRGDAAITAAVVVTVLPYLLAITVLPGDAARWLLRVSPAAAFATQQAAREYPQVDSVYTPVNGYFPLPPWAGLAVLAGWAALAVGAAAVTLRRRDA